MEQKVKAEVVRLILDGKAEDALELLSESYGVRVPKLRVGLPRGCGKRTRGCYNAVRKTISVYNSDMLREPFVILHEFYHHLRTTVDLKHRGTEKYANEFANEYIQAYKLMASQGFGK